MRASEARAAVAALIIAATLDTRAGVADRMVKLETADDPSSTRERAFRLTLVRQPTRDELTTYDSWTVEYQLSIYYPWSPSIEDRIADDSERIEIALSDAALIAIDSGFSATTFDPTGLETGQQMVTARWSVAVRYRQDASIL